MNCLSYSQQVKAGFKEEDIHYDPSSRTLRLLVDLGYESSSWEVENNFRLELQQLSANFNNCSIDSRTILTCPRASRQHLMSSIRSKRVCLSDYHDHVVNSTNPWIFCDLTITSEQVR